MMFTLNINDIECVKVFNGKFNILCLSVSLSLCLSVSLSLPLCLCLFLSVSLTLTLSLCLSYSHSVSLSPPPSLSLSRLIEFFRKVKKWVDMAKLPPYYLEKVEALERKFEVISVIFKKYELEFSAIFQLQESGDKQTTPSKGSGGSGRPRSRKPNKYIAMVTVLYHPIVKQYRMTNIHTIFTYSITLLIYQQIPTKYYAKQ